MLAVLLLFAPPASAHGQATGPSVDRAGLVHPISAQLSAGEKVPGGGCSGGISCCILGQCSIVTIAFLAESGAGYGRFGMAAAYAGMIVATIAGLRPGPATPPPRLDA